MIIVFPKYHQYTASSYIDPVTHLINSVGSFTGCHMLFYLRHFLRKHFPVLGPLNGGDLCTENFDVVFLQHPAVCQLYPTIQCSLTSKCQQNAIRPLTSNNLHKVYVTLRTNNVMLKSCPKYKNTMCFNLHY